MAEEPAKRRRKIPRWLFILAGGVALAFVVCVVIGVIATSSPEYKATATAEAIAAAQATETPTESAVAASTQLATNTPAPTSTPEATDTVQPEPTTVPDAYSSGALGLSRENWEALQGPGSDAGSLGWQYDGGYTVQFQLDRVWWIEHEFEQPVSLNAAREESAALFPQDATLVQTYSPEAVPELTVDLYMSESLAARFPDEASSLGSWWIGGEPGSFTAIYPVYHGKVPHVVLGLGNNP